MLAGGGREAHGSAVKHRRIFRVSRCEERHERAGGDDSSALRAKLVKDGSSKPGPPSLAAIFERNLRVAEHHPAVLDAVIGDGCRILRDRKFVAAHGSVVDELI